MADFKTMTVYIDGPLDAQHLGEVEEKMKELEINLGDLVVLDCTDMTYICSSGLRSFLTMHKITTQKGSKLVIRGLQPLVKKVFDISGFSQIFNLE